ncbi:hypothetical protein IGI37_002919 [Enterococcus sp. AZ194]|uniref:AraC family transcriptional regulator n=1 Tax=Enterococcus sp. AZ194 TaxID=2774629 RepID=UPI003F2724C5
MRYQIEHFDSEDYFEFIQFQQFSYPLHHHQLIEVVYVTKGQLEVLQLDETLLLSAGEAVFFLSNQPHGYNSSEDCTYYAFIFSPNWISPFLKSITGRFPQTPKFSYKELQTYDKQTLEQLFKNPFKTRGFLLLLCGYFYEQVTWTTTAQKNDELLTKIIDYIGRHYKEEITLLSSAKALGYDYSYLSHFISDHLGTPFQKYVNGLRLSYSLDLLQTTDLPIADIAIHAGFPSVRTYNNQFKKAFNMTPRDYLKISTERLNKGNQKSAETN